ncbi:response regulator [bacterium]|nr:response regulator [bacterium]
MTVEHGVCNTHRARLSAGGFRVAGPAVALRVLVVDDNRDAADSLGLLLELNGAAVRVAYGGVDALAQAEDFRPHVGLFDIHMPGMSGLELARAMRERAGGGLSCPSR